ncbi:hypothetical protein [Streptomyces glaucus]|uniref:Uncharacterized protein n=1 Tax=Streptomyces glaucus TaxID=284029 RepID=A0ABN3KFX4_9ACTN
MTGLPPPARRRAVTRRPAEPAVGVAGEPDHPTGDALADTVVEPLARETEPRDPRLDSAHPAWAGSLGLSACRPC